jgi:hypothetical protein
MLLTSTIRAIRVQGYGITMESVARDKRCRDLSELIKAPVVKLEIVLIALCVALVGCGGASTSEQDTDKSSDTATTDLENTTADSLASGSTPNPAFDPLLPTLQQMTTVPIMLPSYLPPEINSVGIEEQASEADPYATEADKYSILLLYADTAPNQTIKPYVHYMTAGRITAWPASAPPPDPTNGLGTAQQLEDVALPDGTVANLERLEPPQGANYDSFTVGTFEKERERYTVMVEGDTPEGETTRQILSTMVRVSGA